MQGSDALSSAPGDTSRESFFGRQRMVPGAHGALMTPVHVYFGGEQSFSVHFGEMSAEFAMWTDVRGLDAIIDACLAAKVRAEIAGADLHATPSPLAAVLDPTDVPF